MRENSVEGAVNGDMCNATALATSQARREGKVAGMVVAT